MRVLNSLALSVTVDLGLESGTSSTVANMFLIVFHVHECAPLECLDRKIATHGRLIGLSKLFSYLVIRLFVYLVC